MARVFVDDLDAAIGFYERLAGVTETPRHRFRDVELARVGCFLLLAGNTAAYRDRVATLLVEDLAPIVVELERAGGEVLDGPSQSPGGDRLIARHPDGSVFEYIAE